MLKSNLFCAFIALVTALTISSAFAHGHLAETFTLAMNEVATHSIN